MVSPEPFHKSTGSNVYSSTLHMPTCPRAYISTGRHIHFSHRSKHPNLLRSTCPHVHSMHWPHICRSAEPHVHMPMNRYPCLQAHTSPSPQVHMPTLPKVHMPTCPHLQRSIGHQNVLFNNRRSTGPQVTCAHPETHTSASP